MPWKIGGNFETVAVTCERTWKKCIIAMVNYLWCEVVSDVVDYLTKEEIIWILMLAIISIIFIYIKYCKKKHAENIVLNKQVLNKVGHKIHDLELKINALTYKIQYGIWPLPHQIYNLNPKKLPKSKIKILNSDDQKKENDLSKSEDSILEWQNVQFSSLNSNDINCQFSRTFLTKNGKYSKYLTNNIYNLYQKFTDSVCKCKSFCKELEYNNKCLNSLNNSEISFKTSKVPSIKTADSISNKKQIALFMTEKRKISCDVLREEKKKNNYEIYMKKENMNKYEAYMKEEKDDIKSMKNEKNEMVQNPKEICRNNINISNNAMVLMNNDALLKEFISISSISQQMHNIKSSRKTLYEVKKRLSSLHNVLRTYQNINRFSEKQELIDKKINELDAITSIEKSDKNNIDTNCNNYFKKNLRPIQCSFSVVNNCEYINLDHLDESSFSLAECSSNTSKTYQCSNYDITSLQNEDFITKTTSFNFRKNIADVESGKVYYISSPESFEDQIQNKPSSIKFITKKCSNIFDEKQFQENEKTSQNTIQNKISNDSDKEEKSTELLLQEALCFKKALLTRFYSKKECPMENIKENNIETEFLSKSNNNHFPSIIIDIKMEEEPITSETHDKVNQRYIHLEMKQRHDLVPKYLQRANSFTYENKRNIENQNCIFETSSQYFNIIDLTIPNNKVKNNVALKPPVYEKVISIVIPVDIEYQNKIDMNEKLLQTSAILGNIQTRVNQKEKFKENNVTDKHSLTMLKLEDLVLEQIKNVRDYIDIFLQSQNRVIFKGHKILQCQDKRDIFQYINETSHTELHNRLTSSNSNTNKVNSLNNCLINAGSINKQQISIKGNILKCYSDICLRRNSRMFAPVTPPIKDKFFNKNNTQHLTAIKELKRKKITDLSLSCPVTLKYYYKNHSKSTHNLNLDNRPL